MKPAAPARILLCADNTPTGGDVRGLLEAAGHLVDEQGELVGAADLTAYALIVVEGSRRTSEALALCRRLRGRLGDAFLPILLITDDGAPPVRLASLESGADTYILRPFAPAELLAQVRAFLRLKDQHDSLADKTAEVHRINKR